ncbi:hypothetical protein D9C73_022281 [Collichthys lucidus]|uniref:Uncharacterized protein n=1 Tax=Collichthys lucidus TaxID=240159 RepID=A0A4U5VIK0_COLLU|nr:hypothetical protein D9C73_022281 [Collichthys lucidus]
MSALAGAVLAYNKADMMVQAVRSGNPELYARYSDEEMMALLKPHQIRSYVRRITRRVVISVFEAMSQRPGRYSQVTKRKIEENSFQGVPLHTGQASDRNLDQREFFGSLARNLEKCMLSQGKDQRGYNKLIDDLKVLYPQYWPQDAAALFGEGEVETLCQKFGIENPRNAI